MDTTGAIYRQWDQLEGQKARDLGNRRGETDKEWNVNCHENWNTTWISTAKQRLSVKLLKCGWQKYDGMNHWTTEGLDWVSVVVNLWNSQRSSSLPESSVQEDCRHTGSDARRGESGRVRRETKELKLDVSLDKDNVWCRRTGLSPLAQVLILVLANGSLRGERTISFLTQSATRTGVPRVPPQVSCPMLMLVYISSTTTPNVIIETTLVNSNFKW